MTWSGSCPVCGHYSEELVHDEGRTLCLDCFWEVAGMPQIIQVVA